MAIERGRLPKECAQHEIVRTVKKDAFVARSGHGNESSWPGIWECRVDCGIGKGICPRAIHKQKLRPRGHGKDKQCRQTDSNRQNTNTLHCEPPDGFKLSIVAPA